MPNWNAPLARPIHIKGGQTLKTVADARAYALAMPEARQSWLTSQRTAALLMEAAEGRPAEALTRQIETVLFHEGRLVI